MTEKSKNHKKVKRSLVRVSGEANQGGRKTMEDFMSIVFERNPEQRFFAVFDGHGGKDAAVFAKNRLWATVKRQKGFHSNNEQQVIKAIKKGFMETHRAMWKELGKFFIQCKSTYSEHKSDIFLLKRAYESSTFT